jgi:hypothetical protein
MIREHKPIGGLECFVEYARAHEFRIVVQVRPPVV